MKNLIVATLVALTALTSLTAAARADYFGNSSRAKGGQALPDSTRGQSGAEYFGGWSRTGDGI